MGIEDRISAELAEKLATEELKLKKMMYKKIKLEHDITKLESDWDSVSNRERRIIDFSQEINSSTARQLIDILLAQAAYSNEPIAIRFNSPGGSIFETLAIYDCLEDIKAQGVPVTTSVLGTAASGAGILLQGGNSRIISPHSWLLIHEVSSVTWGKMSTVEDEVKFAKRLQEQCLDILSSRSTLTKAEIRRRWKRKDWWLSAEETVELGFADDIGYVSL